MAVTTNQQWGRRESVIWPRRGFYHTYAAVFASLLLTAFLIWMRVSLSLSPLERYYLPYYVRTGINRLVRATSKYQLIFVTDATAHFRFALDEDVEAGSTTQRIGGPLPLQLSAQALRRGIRSLWRESIRSYENAQLHAYLAHWIFEDTGAVAFFTFPLGCGVLALLLQLPFALRKDIQRRKELRYGRRLKGPILVSAGEFSRAIRGDGVGVLTDDQKRPIRIPRTAENKHILTVGDTGAGKSTIIRQILAQVEERGESAIVYDPACEFVRTFYSEKRGDIVLNPLDARMPYWNPSAELRRKAEAKALAVSLYQPTGVTNRFFVEAPQKIFAHLLTYLPTPSQLVHWMSDPTEIDRRVKGTEYWMLIDPKAPQQRTGVLGSLSMSADSFRLLPNKEDTNSTWTATEWAENRRGWIFITSRPALREAFRPLISLWLDFLVLRLLNEPDPHQTSAWFVIDELASLQRLPQLHTAITESRKSQNPVVLGFQGKSQLEARYGDDAEAMLSQPATKIFLRTTEPRAAKWVSEAIGEVEIERLRETHYDGHRGGRNFSLDRQTEPLVLPSEVSGLDDLRAFMKFGNHVARFSFPYLPAEERALGFVEREMDDLIVPRSTSEPRPPEGVGDSEQVTEEREHVQSSLSFGDYLR